MTKTSQKIDYAKIQTARDTLPGILNQVNKGLSRMAMGEASPEEVATALAENVVPALEQTAEMVGEVIEALPSEESGLGLGEGNGEGEHEEEKKSPLGASNRTAMDGDDSDKDDDGNADGSAGEQFASLKSQVASLMAENIAMKKASLAKRHASTYPPNMRKAAEDDFLKENEDEDDIEKLEAKVATAERVVKSYHDANLINKAKVPQILAHTAKQSSKLRTASAGNGGIDWRLRR